MHTKQIKDALSGLLSTDKMPQIQSGTFVVQGEKSNKKSSSQANRKNRRIIHQQEEKGINQPTVIIKTHKQNIIKEIEAKLGPATLNQIQPQKRKTRNEPGLQLAPGQGKPLKSNTCRNYYNKGNTFTQGLFKKNFLKDQKDKDGSRNRKLN